MKGRNQYSPGEKKTKKKQHKLTGLNPLGRLYGFSAQRFSEKLVQPCATGALEGLNIRKKQPLKEIHG